MEKKVLTPLHKGLIIGLALVAFSVIMYIAIPDIQQQQKLGWITYVLVIGGLIWACLTYAKEQDYRVTFGNVFAHGFKVTAVMTCIALVYTLLAITVLFPEMKMKMIEVARQQMEAQGQLSESQIDQALEMTEKFFLPFTIGGVLVGYLIMGVIGSLIGALAAKKNPNPSPFESDNLG